MSHLSTFEASTWIAGELCCAPTAMRQFNANLIPHKIPFMVLGYTLFRGFPAVEFLELNVTLNHNSRNFTSIDLPQNHNRLCSL